jgi:eukaryotic-like serine/threonine-protein kinase
VTNGTGGGATRIGGRYELGELLGRGGMAEVRKGNDVRLGRVVAIKRLRTDLASDATFQARFRREAQSAASLNHPAIVAVYDTGEELANDGSDVPQPYIVMEYVAGRTLREILQEGRKILPERALEITSGILAALDYSHRAGIVHRDIKPANVMLTPSGDVKVMDFGIARAVTDASTTVTQTAAVVGTAQYLSPEQARGETVDSRSDVYSTGCLLYELLTGRPPFVGESPVSVAIQHVRDQPAPPSTLDSELAPELDRIVMQALAKRVEDRYQSAAAMRADIERFLAGQPVAAAAVPVDDATEFVPADSAQHTSFFTPPDDDRREEKRKRRWPLVLLVLGIVALLVGAVIFGQMMFSTAPNENSVPSVLNMTRKQAEKAVEDAGLTLGEVDEQASADVPKGRVIAQDPRPLSLVAPDSPVDITLSTGEPEVVIPFLIGKDKDVAEQQLLDRGLEPRLIKQQSDEPKDTVIRTEPNAAENVSKGSTVRVFYSTGPRKVPSVVGLPEEEAIQRIEGRGFVANVEEDTETPAEPGTVLEQDPEAFSRQPQGTVVTITVSRYEEPEPSPTSTPTETPEPSPTPTPSESPPSPTTTVLPPSEDSD